MQRVDNTHVKLAAEWVIRQISKVLRPREDAEHHVARIGPTTFCVVSEDLTPRGARAAAATVLRSVRDHHFELGGRRVPVTVRARIIDRPAKHTLWRDRILRYGDV